MCLAGGVGATINAGQRPDGIVRQLLPPDVLLFAETNTRFVVEVPPEQVEVIKQLFSDLPCECIGVTVALPRLVILGEAEVPWIDVPIPDLKEAWQRPLRW
jgi:phosphoribosylformylglycinamidine synthase